MNFKNFIIVLFTSFIFSGCATIFLATGTAIGVGYVAKDVDENHDGDIAEFFEEKYNNLIDD